MIWWYIIYDIIVYIYGIRYDIWWYIYIWYNGINHLSTGAGFLPSTVYNGYIMIDIMLIQWYSRGFWGSTWGFTHPMVIGMGLVLMLRQVRNSWRSGVSCCHAVSSSNQELGQLRLAMNQNDWIKWSSHWNSWHMNVHPKVNIQNNHRTYRSWTKSMSCPQNSSPGFLWSLRNPIIVPVVVPYVKPPSSSCLVPYVWRILPAVFHGFEPIFHG